MKSLILFFSIFSLLIFSCNDSKSTSKEDEIIIEDEQEEVKKNTGTGTILFFGNSLTAGYGLEENQGFPALIGKRLDSLGFDYEVINAGISGETTSGGLNRVDWTLKQKVDIFVLELGANDGLRGIPLDETRDNLDKIIDMVREKNPDTEIILAGMQLPPNMGPEYTTEFRNIFPQIAEEKNVKLIPFLLDGVGGIPELNQGDGIHPTAEGHKILADNVWEVLEPIVEGEKVNVK